MRTALPVRITNLTRVIVSPESDSRETRLRETTTTVAARYGRGSEAQRPDFVGLAGLDSHTLPPAGPSRDRRIVGASIILFSTSGTSPCFQGIFRS
jgi:hypothetical protein